MNVRRHGSRWEIPVVVFGADLNGNFGATFEVDGPVEPFGNESSFGQGGDGFLHAFRGDDHIHVRGCDWFFRPVVDRQPTDHAPRNFPALQRLHQQRHVVAATGRLPVVELTHRHAGILNPKPATATTYCGRSGRNQHFTVLRFFPMVPSLGFAGRRSGKPGADNSGGPCFPGGNRTARMKHSATLNCRGDR